MVIGKKKTIIQSDVQLFDDAWAAARPLTGTVITDVIADLKEQKESEALAIRAEFQASGLTDAASKTGTAGERQTGTGKIATTVPAPSETLSEEVVAPTVSPKPPDPHHG